MVLGYQCHLIENADATPPHLDVMVHLGSSGGLHGSLQFFAIGLRSLFSSVVSPLTSLFTVGGPSSHIDILFLTTFGGFSVRFRSSWLAWAPLWTHPAPDLLKCQKNCEK